MRSLGDEKYVNQLRMGGGGKGSHEEGRLVVAIDSGGVGGGRGGGGRGGSGRGGGGVGQHFGSLYGWDVPCWCWCGSIYGAPASLTG
jgi:hypothetical protein